MSYNNQNDIDEFDPANLDIEDMVKKRWKSKTGKTVGIRNNRLPTFRKQFIDPKQSTQQVMTQEIREFMREKEIGIKSLDNQPCPYPFLTWNDAQFHKQIQSVLNRLNFRAPTPIQSVVFPLILSGYDVIGVAETGSGKTFGYLLPGLIQIACQEYPGNFRESINGPEMLILAPTRELVMQITQQVDMFMGSYNMKVVAAFGGQNRDQQARQIKDNPNILVACPGRLKDFLQEGIVELAKVTYLVIDEADRLLDMGFEDDVRYIVERTRVDRQTVFFSATWPKAVRNLSFDFCSEKPIYVQIGRSNLTINKNIEQEIICLYQNQKLQTLLDILDQLKINDKVLIFSETRISCEQLSVDMTQEGYYAVALHGDKSQRQRDEIMAYYKKGETKLLCATDLASRGLDVSDITVVINYDFPKYFDDYIHRIGRTGRAGRKGKAFSFFSIEKDPPSMAKELLKFNQVHQIKLNFDLMQDLANGIKPPRNPNSFQGASRNDGQIMTHKNQSKFEVPELTREDKEKFYLQPHQKEMIYNRTKQKNSGKQDFGRPHYGQYKNRQNQRQDDFSNNNQYNNRPHQQRRQQEQSWKQNKFNQDNIFSGQRRDDYQDYDNNSNRNQYQRYGNQNSDYQRQDYKRQNNQYGNQQRFQDNQRDQFDYYRGGKPDQSQNWNPFIQQKSTIQERDQQFTNQRDHQQQPRNQQNFQREQQYNQRDFQRDYQNTPQNNYRDQQGNFKNYNDDQRNYQSERNYQQDPNQRSFQKQPNYGQRNQDQGNPDNYKNYSQTQGQYQNWNDNNDQVTSQKPYDQQNMNRKVPDYYRERDFEPNYQNRNNERQYQYDRQSQNDNQPNQKFNPQQNNNWRQNNSRNYAETNKSQDENLQIRKDSSQQQEIQPNFNNFKMDDHTQWQDNRSGNNQNLYDNLKDNTLDQNFRKNSDNQATQIRQEQTQNNYMREGFQNQSQGYDRQNNSNQRTLLDKKFDQMPQYFENQQRQINERPNFNQQAYQDNHSYSQTNVQNFNKNERIQDKQDFDFTNLPKQMDENKKILEFDQASKSNQQQFNNQNQPQNLDLVNNQGDSQILY